MCSLGNFLLRLRTCNFCLLFPCWSISRTPFPNHFLLHAAVVHQTSLRMCPLVDRMLRRNSISEGSSKLLSYPPNDGECDCLQTLLLRLGTLNEWLLWLVFPGRHFRMLHGRNYGECQVSAIALRYPACQLVVSSLHPRRRRQCIRNSLYFFL
jgi:hypothetical protein